MFRVYLLHILLLLAYNLPAQVPVREEPRHHNVFENEYLRILDVYLEPGDTTLYHLHNTPSVFIVLSNSNVVSQLPGGQPANGANLTGTISYDSINNPRIHRVWNIDTSWFHVMDVELLSKKQNKPVHKLSSNSFQLLFERGYANGYKFAIDGKKQFIIPASANGYLLVCLENAEVEIENDKPIEYRKMKPGHYIIIEADRKIQISSLKNEIAEFTLIQLK